MATTTPGTFPPFENTQSSVSVSTTDPYGNTTVTKATTNPEDPGSSASFLPGGVGLYAALFVGGVLLTVLIVYFLLISLQNRTQFVNGRLNVALDLLVQTTSSARTQAVDLISSGIDFVNIVWADIDLVLSAGVQSFTDVVTTIASGVVDVLNMLATDQTSETQTMQIQFQDQLTNLFAPIFDAVTDVIYTLAAILCAVYQVFDPACAS